jgi:hypothetical protein
MIGHMKAMRLGIVALLALLQLLAPYLHSHAAPSRVGGWHLHLPSGVPTAAGQHPAVQHADEPKAAVPVAKLQATAVRSAAAAGTPSALPQALATPVESPAAEMPAEWLRDPSLPALLDAGWLGALAPPGATACSRGASVASSPGARRLRFSLLAYPAAAPPGQPMHA